MPTRLQRHRQSGCSRVNGYFHGLCLDCLDRSKPKVGDVDMDYWEHDQLKEHEWVHGCRFNHKQPTWYFSFNGRKEERDRMVKMRASERRSRANYLRTRYDSSDDGDAEW